MLHVEPTVFVVDDDPSIRDSLRWLFTSVELPTCAFASAQEFLESFAPDRPGCLIADVRMQGMSGLQLQEELTSRGVAMPIIILTAHGDVDTAVRAMKSGAVEFLTKPYSKQRLLDAVHRYLQEAVDRFRAEQKRKRVKQRLEKLTSRERTILKELARGLSSKMIARKLGISPRTVDVHRQHVMRKMQSKNVVHLVSMISSIEGNR